MPTQKYLARIHIMKKEKAVPEEDYRAILRKLFPTEMKGLDTPTSAVLSDRQALVFIRSLRDFRKDPYSPSDEEIWRIKKMWHEIYVGDHETKHLRQFLFNHVKVSDLNFLDRRKAYEVVEALKAMQKRRAANE